MLSAEEFVFSADSALDMIPLRLKVCVPKSFVADQTGRKPCAMMRDRDRRGKAAETAVRRGRVCRMRQIMPYPNALSPHAHFYIHDGIAGPALVVQALL